MPSLLSKVIESEGLDVEISSIREQVQLGTGDEGWAIHTNGSLRYLLICYASRWHEDVP